MSLTDLSNMYEKMLRNPENRKSSSGEMKQPSPYDSGKMGMEPDVGESSDALSADESSYLADIDRRMAARKAGKPINEKSSDTSDDVSRLVKLEKEVSELQELMTEMMKTHIKLLGKLE